MRFGIFYEHQLPRPWEDGAELRLFQEALDQVELADRVGIDYAWRSSTTSSRSTRTPRARGVPRRRVAALEAHPPRPRIVLMPPAYNPPAAWPSAWPRWTSCQEGDGLGDGESASRAELELRHRPERAARHVARDRRAGPNMM